MKRFIFIFFLLIILAGGATAFEQLTPDGKSMAILAGILLVLLALAVLLRAPGEPGAPHRSRYPQPSRGDHGPDLVIYPESQPRLPPGDREQAYQYRQGWLAAERVHRITAASAQAAPEIRVIRTERAALPEPGDGPTWDDTQQAEWERVKHENHRSS